MHLHVNLCATARPMLSRPYRCRWFECVYLASGRCGMQMHSNIEQHNVHVMELNWNEEKRTRNTRGWTREKKPMSAHGNGIFRLQCFFFARFFFSFFFTIETDVDTKVTRRIILSKCTSARELSRGTKNTKKKQVKRAYRWDPVPITLDIE